MEDLGSASVTRLDVVLLDPGRHREPCEDDLLRAHDGEGTVGTSQFVHADSVLIASAQPKAVNSGDVVWDGESGWYVADLANGALLHVDAAGRVTIMPTTFEIPYWTNVPEALATTSDGRVLVSLPERGVLVGWPAMVLPEVVVGEGEDTIVGIAVSNTGTFVLARIKNTNAGRVAGSCHAGGPEQDAILGGIHGPRAAQAPTRRPARDRQPRQGASVPPRSARRRLLNSAIRTTAQHLRGYPPTKNRATRPAGLGGRCRHRTCRGRRDPLTSGCRDWPTQRPRPLGPVWLHDLHAHPTGVREAAGPQRAG